ncbi:hypothetical protein ACFL6A_04495 [bacterium]
MNAKTRLTACVLCLIILGGILYHVQAGVEPSPFKNLENKVGAIVNKMNNLQHRLDNIYPKLLEQHYYKGIVNQLQSIEKGIDYSFEELITLNDDIDAYWEALELGETIKEGSSIFIDLREGQTLAVGYSATARILYGYCSEMAPELLPPLESIQISSSSLIQLITTLLDE